MKKAALEWKVGLFVLLCLIMAAGLIMRFSKSTSVFTQTYELLLVTSNVGGIRPGASVLMAGVQVGSVRSVDLDQAGKIVTMHAEIQSRFRIHQDAHVTIEQAGFLGDQYISITPGPNQKPEVQPGETVRCQEPFDFQEVARSADGLLHRVDQTATKLNEAVSRIDQTLLAEQTLTNITIAVTNFRVLSDRALSTMHGLDELIDTNSLPLNTAISNLVQFSDQLDQFTTELQLTLATNRVEITSAIRNLHTGTVHLNDILSDVQAGKGLVGSVLKDDQLRADFAAMVSNLAIVSSNLSRHGLLWKPPRPKPTSTGPSIYTGKNPSR